MKKIWIATLLGLAGMQAVAQSSQKKTVAQPVAAQAVDPKLEQDRASIRSMAGCYKVSFEFAETFSPDTAYKYHDRKFEWGIEYVQILKDTDKEISLQHLLIVNDTIIVKHWRQDWVYENTAVLGYYKNNEWIRKTLTPAQAKGTWTQTVYQVDDSPRYSGFGTWMHVDGRHFWESVADAPLPRREITKRSDYNVLRRHNRIEMTENGWLLEQDNEKIVRNNGQDKLLCWEKGFERFTKGNFDCTPAIKWWAKNHQYWADVRQIWSDVYAKNERLSLQKKVDNQLLFEQLFKAEKQYRAAAYNSSEAQTTIRKIIESFVVKG